MIGKHSEHPGGTFKKIWLSEYTRKCEKNAEFLVN